MERDELGGLAREEAEQRVREALEKAERARRRRRYNEGITLLLDALQYGVHKDMVYYRLGNIYFDAGDLVRAEYAYRRAIEENPYHVNAHHNLAVVYKKTGRIEDSVRMQKRAVRLEAGGKLGRSLMGGSPPLAKPVHEELLAGRIEFGPVAAGGASGGEAAGGGSGASAESGGDETRGALDPYDEEEFDPVQHDPEGFRRFGRRVALAGCLVFIAVGAAFLALLYVIGYWLF